MKRLGYVYKRPKCVPAKADAAVQQRFHTETLAPLMQKAGPDQPLYFVDGMHPSYTGHPAHGWIKRGADRELKSNHRLNSAIIASEVIFSQVVRLSAQVNHQHLTATNSLLLPAGLYPSPSSPLHDDAP